MTLQMRRLTAQEKARAFRKGAPGYDRAPYVEAVREMDGGVAYAFALNGTTPRALRMRLGRAATSLGLKLVHGAATDKEIYVELSA